MSEPTPGAAPVLGLSEAEARRRLAEDGPNALPDPERRGTLAIVRDVLTEPMSALLVAGGILYFLLGDTTEAVILFLFASLSIVITVVQETRTEHILEKLRDLTAPTALVLRDGTRRRIPARELVRGDVVALGEGDRIAADARLLEARGLAADESLLTGESVPVAKVVDADRETAVEPGEEAGGHVWSGTLVVAGSGLAEVTATGEASAIGRIGRSLRTVETEAPRLRVETRRIVAVFGAIGAAVSLGAVVLYGLFRGNWLEALLSGIALGMSMLPEEFPLVLTVFVAMGAWRISRARVLTRRGEAIETLGAMTVLCTDKTGTLTENRMRVVALAPAGAPPRRLAEAAPLDDPAERRLLAAAVAACARHPHDPMEIAFHDLARAAALDPTAGAELWHEWGLADGRLAVTRVWRRPGAAAWAVVKGAPETVAGLCACDAAARADLARTVEAMAASGLRVLAVAEADTDADTLPATPSGFAFTLLGLVGLADPLRPGVREAIAAARTAGVRLVMITGDHPVTARAVAADAGIAADTVLTGPELDAADDARIAETAVFARVRPDQKLRIVRALAARGDVVAMTGDGVNDAPSLKAAHIGIAMGRRGTDVAREAAAIVLLDDDFGAVAAALRLGRRIWDNLEKAMAFVVAVHVPIAGLALAPLAFGLPILLGPIHIALLEMVIDPVCSLVFEAEPEEADVGRRAPRDPAAPLLSRGLVVWGLVQGLVTLAAVAAVALLAAARAMPEDEIRAVAFFALVFGLLGLIFVGRSFGIADFGLLRRRNTTLVVVLTTVVAVMTALVSWPPAARLLHFGPLHGDDLAVASVAGLAAVVLLQAIKRPLRRALG